MSSNRKKYSVFFPLLFSIVLALGMYLGFKLRDNAGPGYNILIHGSGGGTLQEILDLIRVKYVDTMDQASLNSDAINGILSHLDPHSVYIPPEDLEGVNDDLEGDFEGIGVEFTMVRDTVNIVSVLPNGPSASAGLLLGDQILKINDSVVCGVHTSLDRIRELLRGSSGTMAGLLVRRNGKLLEFSVRRGMVQIQSIDASYMITPDIGYIRINRFADNTYREFMQAITPLKASGMKKLIIDLRQNPGGFLEAATAVADELLDDHKLIVYTEGK
ncbi:MAG TPA: S41 family peptidase, partial [Chitinophagaceae bacterium]|nr:S41 family peptidase [Chitinophagaceae bacterium]